MLEGKPLSKASCLAPAGASVFTQGGLFENASPK